jgi:hypothetical protein
MSRLTGSRRQSRRVTLHRLSVEMAGTGLNRAKRDIRKKCARVADEKRRRTRKTRQMAKRLESGQERLNGWNVD